MVTSGFFEDSTTIIVCTNGSLHDSTAQFGKNWPQSHLPSCIDGLVVSMPGTVLPAAPCNPSQSHGYPALWCGAMQYHQSPVAQRNVCFAQILFECL